MAQFPIDIVINTADAAKLGPLNRQLNETDRSATAATAATRALGVAVTAVASATTLGQLVRLSDSYTKVQNSIVNVVSGTAELTSRTAELLQVANSTRSSFESTAALYGKLQRATTDLGISQQRTLRITELINKGFIASGATSTEASNAITQLAQGLAAGALRGDEFNSVAEQAPVILRAVAQETGLATGQLREFAATGGITADILIRAIENYGDTVDREFARTAQTFDQQLVVARNLATEYVGSSDAIRSASAAAGAALVTVAGNLDTVVDAATALAVVYGARLAGSIAASTTALVAQRAATIAQLQADVALAEAAKRRADADAAAALRQVAAARQVTEAKREQAAAEAALTLQAQTQGLKTTAETARLAQAAAAAEANSIRVKLQAIEAEQALEKVRLAAQISERGRIDTATRFAALGESRAVLTAQLTAAEKTLAAATVQTAAAETAVTTAQRGHVASAAQLTISNKALTAAQASQTVAVETAAIASQSAAVANANLTISQRALATATSLTTTATRTLSSAMALLGGPVGVAVIAGAALLTFTSNSAEARKELEQGSLNKEIETLVGRFKELNAEGQKGLFVTLEQEASAVRQQLVAAQDDFKRLNDAASARTTGIGVSGEVEAARKRIVELENQLNSLSAKQQAVFDARAPQKWNDALKESKPAAKELTTEFERLTKVGEGINKLFSGGLFGELPEDIANAQKLIDSLTRQSEALRLTGVNQDVYNNLAQLGSGATAEQRAQVEALTRSIYAQNEAEKQRQRTAETLADIRTVGNAVETPGQKLQREYDERESILIGALSDELITFEEYKKRQTNLEAEYDKKRLEQQAATQSAVFTATAQGFDALAGIIDAAGGKQTAAYRVAYVASRAFALADSILKVTQAQAQALADPTAITLPQKFANYAAIATAGASLLSAFKQPSGFANGGPVSGPGTGRSDSIPAWLSNGEFVMPANRTSQYSNELEAMRRGTYSTSPTTSAARVTINNYASDVVTASVAEGPNGDLITTIDRRIAEQTPRIMSQQLGDPYSESTRTLNSSYRLERN